MNIHGALARKERWALKVTERATEDKAEVFILLLLQPPSSVKLTKIPDQSETYQRNSFDLCCQHFAMFNGRLQNNRI